MDAIEKHGLYVIPSIGLSWHVVAEDETLNDFVLNRSSASRALAHRYYEEFVGRYHARKSVLFWELGNEFNLLVNLPPPHCDAREHCFTTKPMNALLAELVGVIRKIDPERPITSGHSAPRPQAWHMEHCKTSTKGSCASGFWGLDTEEQYMSMLAEQHLSVDIISVHLYASNECRFGASPGDCAQNASALNAIAKAASAIGKQLFLGEYGGPGPKNFTGPSLADQAFPEAALELQVEASHKHSSKRAFVLSAVWAWECATHRDDMNCIYPGSQRPGETGSDRMLGLLQSANRQMNAKESVEEPNPHPRPNPSRAMTMVALDSDTEARCLDGSPYAYYIIPGSNQWSIGIHGGGWCYNEADCLARSRTGLGSSTGWNASWAFGPPASTCQGLADDCTRVFLPYCDGASFTGYRAAPFPVTNSTSTLMFRGLANWHRTLAHLTAHYQLGSAKEVVLWGGSAGGLSTLLHLDRLAASLPRARVVGRPVAGYFLDYMPMPGTHFPYAGGYPGAIKLMAALHNVSGGLSTACQALHRQEPWRCAMAPYAQQFVQTPFFVVQSRFDQFQLGVGAVDVPCIVRQPYMPPYQGGHCNATEITEIRAFGEAFMAQVQPVIDSPRNGLFLVNCVQHNVAAKVGNITEASAFESWYSGGNLGRRDRYNFVDLCGNLPCNAGSACAPV